MQSTCHKPVVGNPGDGASARDALPSVDLARDALLLDVDGTVLDIAPTPEEVVVPASLKRTLTLLIEKAHGAVALVSGRQISVLDRLFGPLRLPTIGCHGAELRASPSTPTVQRSRPLPELLKRAISGVAARERGLRVEDKLYTLALHFRAAPEREGALLAELRELLESSAPNLTMLRGKFVIEVKPNEFDKGEALRALMRLPPFAGRRPVFFGDDTTDEDVFAALPELRGLGICVGRRSPQADFMMRTPREVRQWLATLAGNAGEIIE